MTKMAIQYHFQITKAKNLWCFSIRRPIHQHVPLKLVIWEKTTKRLQDAGYEILGVSADSEKRQSNFKKKFNFPYPLLADTEKEVINAFGVWGPKKFMGREFDGIHRITFIVNEDGVVERVIDKVKAKIHTDQILEG